MLSGNPKGARQLDRRQTARHLKRDKRIAASPQVVRGQVRVVTARSGRGCCARGGRRRPRGRGARS